MTEEIELNEFMTSGALRLFALQYYSPELESTFTFDDEQTVHPSLQVVYDRSYKVNGNQVKENYWLYFAPEDAVAIGSALLAWGEANKGHAAAGFEKGEG